MRLLDTTTYVLSEFQGEIPVYAILSHVWEQEEVIFGDIAMLSKATKMKGFTKIRGACKAALKDGLKYIWIDTCCINKESSSELSEAINSMFTWYKNARVCYAFLSDVPSDEDPSQLHSSFATSQWFTRGWTLQELLAPPRVIFHARDWVDIGTKATLRETISKVTGISIAALLGIDESKCHFKLESVPVAVRMSWAADRLTTREEDTAYSLMGLFGVNLPLLYGEGGKAFIRLQHEIIKASDDHSIFAFTGGPGGMLARSPGQFRESGRVKLLDYSGEPQAPYSMTNKGLHIQLPLCIVTESDSEENTLALLNCYLDDKSQRLAVMLTTSRSRGEGWYRRSNANKLHVGISPGWSPPQLHSIYILDDIDSDGFYHQMLGQMAEPFSTSESILMTAIVPAEYGKLNLFYKPGREWHEAEESTENEWRFTTNVLALTLNGLERVFECVTRGDKFRVTVGTTFQKTSMWCTVQTYGRIGQNYFLDRSSATLNDGWVVTVTSGHRASSCSGIGVLLHAEIEIKRATIPWSPLAMPKRPTDTCIAWLVTPPAALHHGYSLAENDIFPPLDRSSSIICIPYRGSLIAYMEGTIFHPVVKIPFKSSSSERPFYLLLKETGSSSSERVWVTAITQATTNTFNFNSEGGRVVGASYSAILDGGKTVYVTSWRNRDKSLADYVVKLAM
jgi:hypothetical protein